MRYERVVGESAGARSVAECGAAQAAEERRFGRRRRRRWAAVAEELLAPWAGAAGAGLWSRGAGPAEADALA